jgi:hypothetical protein
MLLSVLDGQTSYDIVLKSGSPLENFAQILVDNELGFNYLPVSDTIVNVDNNLIYTPPTNIVYTSSQQNSNIKTLVSVDNQTIYDVALMTYGALEKVCELLTGGLDERITPRTVFNYDYNQIANYIFYNQVQNKFGYICTSDLEEGITDNNLLITEDYRYIITEDSVYIAV